MPRDGTTSPSTSPPRETVIKYLAHAFPVQLQEPLTDDDGNVMSRPVFDNDGNPVICQEAAARRDSPIEKLAALPPVGETAPTRVKTVLRAGTAGLLLMADGPYLA